MEKFEAFIEGNAALGRFKRFFEGRLYPALTVLCVLIGSTTGSEFILNIFNILAMSAALLLVDSVLALLVPFTTIIYQVSLKNSPGHPTFSDYYFSGWRLPVLIFLIIIFALSIGFFLFRMQIWRRLSFKKTPLLLPLIILSLAFLLNGVFSEGVGVDNLLFALSQAFAFLGIFAVFAAGLSEKDDAKRIGEYFSYASLLITLLLFSELLVRYITAWDAIFAGGSIVKDEVLLGWGIWNPIGVSIAVLIPMNFYGALKSRHHLLYFGGAILATLGAFMSMSRNAMIFSSLAFLSCILICCFVGEQKRFFRITSAVGAAMLAVLAIALREKLFAIISSALSLGDNGRFDIWGEAIREFLKNPLFGTGFWSVPSDAFYVTSFLPPFAHQTFVELLSACGIVGLLAYLFYRAKSAVPFLRRPTLLKTMLGISILVLLGESLLDNFVFYIYTMVYYNAALASAFHLDAISEG